MKVLNLYSGIGGNRELWKDCEVTAVEYNEKIAEEYSSKFQNDTVIVGDAHQYLLENHKRFDFIWSSPPCQSHSRTNYFTQYIRKIPVYPSMNLYEEILFLNHFFKGKFCIENVIPYYKPLIKPTQIIGRHYFWSNFKFNKIKQSVKDVGTMDCDYGNTACKTRLEERNAVNSELGLHIFETAKKITDNNSLKQIELF